MEYVLETNGLSKRYRDFTALNGLNMHIPKGSIYGFVGRNGAGKTTLIRLICGLQEPTSGSFTRVGLLGTKYTMEQDFYKGKLAENGISVVIPEEDDIEAVNSIIYDELCMGRKSRSSLEENTWKLSIKYPLRAFKALFWDVQKSAY